MKHYLELLGFEVRDVVTGFTGIATTIGFDLFGCVQVIVSPEGIDEKGELKKSSWFDHKRLVKTDRKAPVMAQPTFETVPGGYDKPLR